LNPHLLLKRLKQGGFDRVFVQQRLFEPPSAVEAIETRNDQVGQVKKKFEPPSAVEAIETRS